VTRASGILAALDHPAAVAVQLAGVSVTCTVNPGRGRGPLIRLAGVRGHRLVLASTSSSWPACVVAWAFRASVLGLVSWGELIQVCTSSQPGATPRAWACSRRQLHHHARHHHAGPPPRDVEQHHQHHAGSESLSGGPHDPQDPIPTPAPKGSNGSYPPLRRDADSERDGDYSDAKSSEVSWAKRARVTPGMIRAGGEVVALLLATGYRSWDRSAALEKGIVSGRKGVGVARPTDSGLLRAELERNRILGCARAVGEDCAYAECLMCRKVIEVTKLTCSDRCRQRLARWRKRKGLKSRRVSWGGWNRKS
jgi:hypothetical protein